MIPIAEGMELRRAQLAEAKRIVVKVGSAVLTSDSGLNQEVLANLAAEISWLKESGREVILVRLRFGCGRAAQTGG